MPGPRPNPAKPYSRYRAGVQGGRKGLRVLPSECTLPPPKLPAGRKWAAHERALWRELWSSPQATQWDDSYGPAVAQYVVHTAAVLGGSASAWQASEARHLGDRLGLTPQGLAGLGWALSEAEPAPLSVLPGGAR
jgi:hypothetical protein